MDPSSTSLTTSKSNEEDRADQDLVLTNPEPSVSSTTGRSDVTVTPEAISGDRTRQTTPTPDSTTLQASSPLLSTCPTAENDINEQELIESSEVRGSDGEEEEKRRHEACQDDTTNAGQADVDAELDSMSDDAISGTIDNDDLQRSQESASATVESDRTEVVQPSDTLTAGDNSAAMDHVEEDEASISIVPLEGSTTLVDKMEEEDPAKLEETVAEEEMEVVTKMDGTHPPDDASSSQAQQQAVPSSNNIVRPVKRARSAYLIFADEKRSQVAKEHRGVAAVSKAVGAMWNALSDEEKQVYKGKAVTERTRVASELEEWKKAHPNEASKASSLSTGTTTADESAEEHHHSNLIFPIAKMRRICKLDPDVRGISREALVLITKASELALAQLGKETVTVANIQNRRKLLPEDVAMVCESREQFQFLREDITDLTKLQQKEKITAAATAAAAASANTTASSSSIGTTMDLFTVLGDASKKLAATSNKTKNKAVAEVAPPPSTKPLSAYFAVKPKD